MTNKSPRSTPPPSRHTTGSPRLSMSSSRESSPSRMSSSPSKGFPPTPPTKLKTVQIKQQQGSIQQQHQQQGSIEKFIGDMERTYQIISQKVHNENFNHFPKDKNKKFSFVKDSRISIIISLSL